ncbi:putative integral membrane protein [Kitasatospora sp. SolWspMP-SS2h]|uniref:lipopolysaccharide assembly protein LapA domain-containing protein n=1 Tax=Kitasatospora sp. SolWspMP-SS2h TaxID=1305729 RepID=UPI000DBA394A|nr:lipopolysaccharide assembly protein LapA domain-containing protein [Kitasatospora sp. SolWspMP-SS2h]RAJ39978.1 putative integral membrane protein [Kitasatospora sp. SolWspMP-SS2h]
MSIDRPAPDPPVSRSDTGGAPLRTKRSRSGAIWAGAITATLILVLLLVFILQNGQHVEVSYLGAHGRLPLGVALLLAAASGVLLVAVPGSARIWQLRRAARRQAATGAVPLAGGEHPTVPHEGRPGLEQERRSSSFEKPPTQDGL